MRIDFREERKWKLALAYNLAKAVVEWHEAGTKEEREKRGICLNWRKPKPTEETEEERKARKKAKKEAKKAAKENGESSKEKKKRRKSEVEE